MFRLGNQQSYLFELFGLQSKKRGILIQSISSRFAVCNHRFNALLLIKSKNIIK
jgi:hypothetical protein